MYRFSRRGILGAARKFSSSGSSSESHYETLGLKPSATQAEVKAAYFELSKLYHPDKTKGSEESLDKFRSITEAYEVLGKSALEQNSFCKHNLTLMKFFR